MLSEQKQGSNNVYFKKYLTNFDEISSKIFPDIGIT